MSTTDDEQMQNTDPAALEQAARQELQRRVEAAHAEITQLLRDHAGAMTPRQVAGIRRWLVRHRA